MVAREAGARASNGAATSFSSTACAPASTLPTPPPPPPPDALPPRNAVPPPKAPGRAQREERHHADRDPGVAGRGVAHDRAAILADFGRTDEALPLRRRTAELAPDYKPALLREADGSSRVAAHETRRGIFSGGREIREILRRRVAPVRCDDRPAFGRVLLGELKAKP